VNHCNISNNVVSNSGAGIGLENSTYNNVTNNNVSNTSYAINAWRLNYFNRVINNTIFNTTSPSGNHSFAIAITDSGNNTVDNNYICNTTASGTDKISAGIIVMSLDGTTSNNTITNNEIYDTTASGGGFTAGCGIFVMNTTDNKFLNNTVSSNDFGIVLNSTSNNTIYNNYFNNDNNAQDDGNNTWNTTKTNGTNIVGGPYIGGNYWSDYNGSDTNEDGLGDTGLPYNCSGNIQDEGDYLPLIVSSATLEGHVSFYRDEGPGNSTWATPLVVRFFDNSTGIEAGWSPKYATTDAYGNFTVDGIAVGTYDIGIKNYTTHSKMVYGKAFTAGNTTAASFGTLVEADCDDSDKTDASDYSRVLNNYNVRKVADPTFWATYDLWKADYTRDDKVDASDYSAVLNNYGERGDIFYYTH